MLAKAISTGSFMHCGFRPGAAKLSLWAAKGGADLAFAVNARSAVETILKIPVCVGQPSVHSGIFPRKAIEKYLPISFGEVTREVGSRYCWLSQVICYPT